MARPRLNNWFVDGEGIAREVITADIQRYLGNDAVVWPGISAEGIPGYWVKAYRTLTSEMIRDLQADSKQWEDEKRAKLRQEQTGRGVEYQDSQTHASRQHWGPTSAPTTSAGREPPRQPASYAQPSAYSSEPQSAYTTAPTPHQPSYPPQNPGYQAPRNVPADPYGGAYAQPAGGHPAYSTQQAYYSSTQPDPYGRPQPPPTQNAYTPTRTAPPGFYIASDGNQYPLPSSQQPQPQPPQRSGGPRRPNAA